MTREQTRIADLIVQVQRQFLEGAPLTAREIQQRVAADGATCEALLTVLVDAGVLVRLDDLYMRMQRSGPGAPPGTSPRIAA
jgi:hypothetical protein